MFSIYNTFLSFSFFLSFFPLSVMAAASKYTLHLWPCVNGTAMSGQGHMCFSL